MSQENSQEHKKQAFDKFKHGILYGNYEDIGGRQSMENYVKLFPHFNSLFFEKCPQFGCALFDGHIGIEAAAFCCENLPINIAHEIYEQYYKPLMTTSKNNQCHDQNNQPHNINDNNNNNVGNNVNNMTHQHDHSPTTATETINSATQSNGHCTYCLDFDNIDLTDAIKKGFIKTDEQWKKIACAKKSESGAVGVFAFITEHILYVANCGDVRAVLCREGKPVILTTEHRPEHKHERNPTADQTHKTEEAKTQHSDDIGVTRAMGDFRFNDSKGCHKLHGLTCVPDVTRTQLLLNDEFVVIGCDGLWDVLSTRTALTDCRRALRKSNNCNKAAEVLVKAALHQKTTDNVSVIVIGFGNKTTNDDELQIVEPVVDKSQSRLINRRALQSQRMLINNDNHTNNNDGNDDNNNNDKNVNRTDNDNQKNVSLDTLSEMIPSRSQ